MTDKAYREFIQALPSRLDGTFSEWLESEGEWRNPGCHVRRAGKSGTAYKEPFAEIPMTQAQHDYQHRFGELGRLRKYSLDAELIRTLDKLRLFDAEYLAKCWFDEQVVKYREMWRARAGQALWEAHKFVNGTICRRKERRHQHRNTASYRPLSA